MEQAQAPDRNLAMDLARVTEAAALAAGRWMGRGDKEAADQAAVDAMRLVLNTVAMDGIVVIGEGEKDEAPMLFNGEEIGAGGPRLRHRGRPDRRHHAHVARSQQRDRGDRGRPSGARCSIPGPCVYMEKIAVGPEARRRRSTSTHRSRPTSRPSPRPRASRSRTSPRSILDRDRHADIIRECRDAGARIKLIPDGDVAGALATAWPDSGTDILFGIGGTPEGVIAACALKALGGAIQGRLVAPQRGGAPRRPRPAATTSTGSSPSTTSSSSDDVFFAATGVTDGDLLRGVRYFGDGARTQTIVMRSKSGTIRTIDATHRWHKLMRYSALKY